MRTGIRADASIPIGSDRFLRGVTFDAGSRAIEP